MSNLFSLDGPLYKICNVIYYLMVLNFLWVIFSIPIITCGASTTALFYVTGKVIREENVHALKDFWNSFRKNFIQSTIIWIILVSISCIIYTNIKNITSLGSIAKFIYPMQIVILVEIGICAIYIFPILSRYHVTIKDAFKSSLIIGNTHILCTLSCIGLIAGIFLLYYKIPGLFIIIFFSLYAYCSYWLIYKLFKKIMPQEKEIEEESDYESERNIIDDMDYTSKDKDGKNTGI